ncbi:translation initiation factor IF-3, mitochondrial isoform X1 [Hippoglossus stenolepis]|uniref:translation initiation factor IF-3, mitochondrial isoform X1 n=1 Tax=Hippoglossus stenolepis TaxID=195615 RepID=UPI001FAF5A68|nr:translation initiation factor IF-3, mitochondrial isoform X1 [Hippoglossus stenolepis]XP_034999954.2 translation initiation factor IF-3, mitochondrial isoform X1 [Hippoglossus stenolepis]
MSAGCMRWVLNHGVRAVCGVPPGSRIAASRFLNCGDRSNIVSWSCSPFSTAADDADKTPIQKKKKQDPRSHTTISSIGRKIPQKQIQVISETGEDMGRMHRADAIRVMDEQGLKLVLLNEHNEPPLYQLMSGKQIHQEQLKLREKQKAKPASVQVKELSFSSIIASHDLSTKLKQVDSWLGKKHHVRITLRSARGAPPGNLDTTLEQMVEQLEVMVGFVSKPTVIREGRGATCILRPASAKEIAQKVKKSAAPQSDNSRPKAARSQTSSVSSEDATEGSIQP